LTSSRSPASGRDRLILPISGPPDGAIPPTAPPGEWARSGSASGQHRRGHPAVARNPTADHARPV